MVEAMFQVSFSRSKNTTSSRILPLEALKICSEFFQRLHTNIGSGHILMLVFAIVNGIIAIIIMNYCYSYAGPHHDIFQSFETLSA